MWTLRPTLIYTFESNYTVSGDILVLFDTIQLIKTRVVRQLDVSTTHITASVDQEPGHEGYVTSTAQQPLKLVDRLRFSRANFARNS